MGNLQNKVLNFCVKMGNVRLVRLSICEMLSKVAIIRVKLHRLQLEYCVPNP